MSDAFYTLYQGLEREGPGEAADVAWAAGVIGLARNARICDAGCGSGADIPALLAAAPEGHVTAIDNHRPFIDELLVRMSGEPRVMAYKGNMAKLKGPYDLIWSAGAMYFLGVRKGLTVWRPALAKGGAVAFTEPCFFTDTPSEATRVFWEGYNTGTDDEIAREASDAGYETLATRRISDAAWEAYYTPLEARIALLRPTADEALTAVLDAAAAEIATWRAVKSETGYLLSVVRPV